MENQIVFADINKEALNKYLESLNSSTECEIRLGSFVYIDNKPQFVATVEIDFFYRLKQILDKQEGLKKTVLITKENSFDNTDDKKGKIREIIHKDTNVHEYMLKNTHRKHNVFDYDCRISLSSEKKLVKNDIKGVSLNRPSFIRYKNRTSYEFKCGTLDMTIVNQGKTQEQTEGNIQYEVEFEISKNNYEEIMQVLTFILQIRQNNNYVINARDKRNVINQYRELVMPQKKGHPFFIGAQPETLQKDQLSLLFKELYSVTDKADGDRYFMFVDNMGSIWFVDNNINNILKTDLKSKHKNCILDGELIKNDKSIFYAFDILFYNGIDLRGDEKYLLKNRLEKVDDVISNISNSHFFTLQIKKFIYRNVFMGSDIIMKDINNKPYKNDGLIFTPMNEPYPKTKKWQKLLKWKPAELNTIDFFAIKNNKIWELYVQDTINNTYQQFEDKNFPKKTELVLFDINKLCDFKETQITFQTTFDDNLLDPTTNEQYKSKTVIEFQWDKTQNKFIPLRTRWDKTANPSKHGNYSSVACSIWNNINNPITTSQLFQMTNSTTDQVGGSKHKNFFFDRMNKFHSDIKEYICKKYIQEIKDKQIINLELNTFNQIKLENTYTFCNSIKQSNEQYKNLKLDLTSASACSIVKNTLPKNTQADNIFCFKFNTFLQSSEILSSFINTIKYNIKQNGKVILLFIDYDKVKTLKHDNFIYNNEIMYIAKPSFNEKSDSVFNNTVKLFINGISNENDTIEYIISYESLLTEMTNNGFSCLETNCLDTLYKMYNKNENCHNLYEYEENISNLYRYCVFEKTESVGTTILHSNEKVSLFSYNPNSSIVYKDLAFYRIKTLYDIFDILNCISFTIFKNNYSNKDITSFDDCTLQIKELSEISSFYNKSSLSELPSNYIYFHNYNYIETPVNDTNEPVIINQFYIVLYKNTILHSPDTITFMYNMLTQEPENVQIENVQIENVQIENAQIENVQIENVQIENVQIENVQIEILEKTTLINNIKNQLQLNDKITILKLKEYLKLLKCKLTGNKDELLSRLHKELNMI
jgi:hypothetical protein